MILHEYAKMYSIDGIRPTNGGLVIKFSTRSATALSVSDESGKVIKWRNIVI